MVLQTIEPLGDFLLGWATICDQMEHALNIQGVIGIGLVIELRGTQYLQLGI